MLHFVDPRKGADESTKECQGSCDLQALEKWGNWGQIAPGVSNGQSEIKFTKLEFARPEPVAAQFDPDEGFTGDHLASSCSESLVLNSPALIRCDVAIIATFT